MEFLSKNICSKNAKTRCGKPERVFSQMPQNTTRMRKVELRKQS
jgi:hypothetical protein